MVQRSWPSSGIGNFNWQPAGQGFKLKAQAVFCRVESLLVGGELERLGAMTFPPKPRVVARGGCPVSHSICIHIYLKPPIGWHPWSRLLFSCGVRRVVQLHISTGAVAQLPKGLSAHCS